MKIKFAALLPLLCAGLISAEEATLPAGSLAALDARYGFRDLKFEQAIDSCQNMVVLEDDGDMKFYTRKDDVLEQGGTKLKPIEYGFYKGKLACVMLNVAADGDPAPLLKSLEVDFGPGRQSPSKAGKLYWFGQKVLVDYWSGGAGRGTVGMWSKPLQAQQIADRKAGKKEAGLAPQNWLLGSLRLAPTGMAARIMIGGLNIPGYPDVELAKPTEGADYHEESTRISIGCNHRRGRERSVRRAGCCAAGKTKVQASDACDMAGKLSLTDAQKTKLTALRDQAKRAPSTSEANAIMVAGLEKILTAEQLAECKASCEKDKAAGKCPLSSKTDKKS